MVSPKYLNLRGNLQPLKKLKFTSFDQNNTTNLSRRFSEYDALRYKTNEFRNLRSVFKLPEARVKMQSGGPW